MSFARLHMPNPPLPAPSSLSGIRFSKKNKKKKKKKKKQTNKKKTKKKPERAH